jgi:hypothetical protein
MRGFPSRLATASSPTERMEALCAFIEFWLGRRLEAYGEPPNVVAAYSLPMPLQRLYEFAGRWPGFDKHRESKFAIGAFSCQDSLRPIHRLEMVGQDRVKFIDENQGCWVCSTLVDGDDPPVWCEGDVWDNDGELPRGGKKVCDSLSKFLVTFVLQEITLGSRFCLSDDGLTEQFETSKADAIPVWDHGPYVHGSDASFFLWNGTLVADLWGSQFFGANHEPGLAFLTENQGAVNRISLMAGLPWRLDIRQDGAARLRYADWPVEEEAEVKVGTFDFDSLLKQLSEQLTSGGHPDRNPVLFLHRRGQSGAEGKHLQNSDMVSGVFRRALGHLSHPGDELQRLFRERWPY